MVACLTPDQQVGGSNPSVLRFFYFYKFNNKTYIYFLFLFYHFIINHFILYYKNIFIIDIIFIIAISSSNNNISSFSQFDVFFWIKQKI